MPRATAAALRSCRAREAGPGISVTSRRSWARPGPPTRVGYGVGLVVISHSDRTGLGRSRLGRKRPARRTRTAQSVTPECATMTVMVTLQALLDVAELGLVPRHVPSPGAEVRWVATSELADPSPYLEGGEVLLTTGLETAGWGREWAPYVRRLAGAGVVAVGLAAELTHDTSPEPLLAACRHEGVALFEVPRDTTFVAISRATAGLLQAEEESATRSTIELQRQLTQAALRE